jgi:hypothetical protein
MEFRGGSYYRFSPLTSPTAAPTEAERTLLARKCAALATHKSPHVEHFPYNHNFRCAVLKFATDSKLSRAELFANYIKKYKDGRDPETKKKKKDAKNEDTTEKKLDFDLDEE